MLPYKNKTSSWQCTVAGTLSVHCPSLFCSGTKLFGENGWWSLQETKPPKLIDVMKTLGNRVMMDNYDNVIGDHMRKGGNYRSSVTNESRKRTLEEKEKESVHKKIKEDPELMMPLSLHQERLLLNFMSSKGTVKDPSYSRILRKLKVSQLKRELGQPLFNLSQYTKESLDNTKHYTASEYHELPYPLVNLSYHKTSSDNLQFSTSKAISIMSRVNNPILPVLVNHHVRDKDTFISQYTSHLLPYVIFKSSSFLPPKIQILKELVTKVSPDDKYSIKPIIFSYFRKHHLSSVNAFISYFFWPVDLSEYLQYPDFTVIVTYGNKIIIGCGFMTPDASISESYIPFLLVHPDYQCTGIGKIILYHLIQSCQGKDVLLHVAVDNKAMLMYQRFGFKTEQFCIDFYDKYHPHNYHLSKHAFLMRLRR